LALLDRAGARGADALAPAGGRPVEAIFVGRLHDRRTIVCFDDPLERQDRYLRHRCAATSLAPTSVASRCRACAGADSEPCLGGPAPPRHVQPWRWPLPVVGRLRVVPLSARI